MKCKLLLPVTALSCLVWSGSARATLIAYDGFETYTSGANLSGNTGGTGWATNWSAIATGVNVVTAGTPLAYNAGAIQVNGGTRAVSVSALDTTDNVASRSFSAQSGTVYFSFLFRLAVGTSDNDFIQFSLNDNTLIANSGSIGDLSNVADANQFATRIGGLSGGTSVNSSTSVAQATTYLLVGKISKVSSTNYNRMELFINPTTTTETGVVATQNASAGISSISFFTVRVSNIEATDQYQFDELRIGTTWADVVPIPEPASWTALAGGLGLLAGLFRRRRA